MTTPPPVPNFARGQEAADRAERGVTRLTQLQIKKDEVVYVRFITDVDDLIGAKIHSYVPTKPQPKSYTGRWPKAMWAMCQNDPAWRIPGQDAYYPGFGDCWINRTFAGQLDSFKKDMGVPADQTFGLVVVQEPVFQEVSGKKRLAGFKDKTVEYTDAKGDITEIPQIMYVSQKEFNFWGDVRAAGFLTGTICPQIFMIKREGNDYIISVQYQTPGIEPGQEGWKKYALALALTGWSIESLLTEHASPEYYARFFIPQEDDDKEAPAGDSGSAAPAAPTSPAAPQVSDDEMAALRAELNNR